VFGEEYGGELIAGRQWVIDPIDATKNYLRGNPIFATLIALRNAGATLVAVVSAPALGRRWFATKGDGAWCGDTRLTVSHVSQTHHAFFGYGGISWWETSGRADAFDRLIHRCWRARGIGDFWMYMMVAEGALDIAIEPTGLKIWDTLAPKLIVEEAGGRVSNFTGGHTDDGSLVATNGLLHEEVLGVVLLPRRSTNPV
jgi:histidinol-phosphatase